jgi:tyrosinase
MAFTIHFFIGDPPADPNAWSATPNLIGGHAQSLPNVSLLYPQGSTAGLQQGEISLTHTLATGIARGLLSGLTPASVIPRLAQSLNWRARAADGCEIHVDSLTDLSIAVSCMQVRSAATQAEFPIHGATQYHIKTT